MIHQFIYLFLGYSLPAEIFWLTSFFKAYALIEKLNHFKDKYKLRSNYLDIYQTEINTQKISKSAKISYWK